jgi:aminoglycoside phosphotransferase (APT) family kinase protein
MHNKLGNKIAEGGCSEVFEWENAEKIIKLAKANTNVESMRREFNNNRVAWEIGLPVAQPYEMLDIDDRPGIIFERVVGESMLDRFMKHLFQYAQADEDFLLMGIEDIRTTAQILSKIHNHSNLTMPSQREYMKYSINRVDYLTPAEKESVIDYLDRLPVKRQLCHGDPNPGNILIRSGKPVVIDWMDASIGNPEADLAEYIVMIRFGILPPGLPSKSVSYFDSLRETIIKVFIDEYTQLSYIPYDEIDSWIIPIAARKLFADAISDAEKEVLVHEIRRRLGSNVNSI